MRNYSGGGAGLNNSTYPMRTEFNNLNMNISAQQTIFNAYILKSFSFI
jgi:hypothetical protein